MLMGWVVEVSVVDAGEAATLGGRESEGTVAAHAELDDPGPPGGVAAIDGSCRAASLEVVEAESLPDERARMAGEHAGRWILTTTVSSLRSSARRRSSQVVGAWRRATKSRSGTRTRCVPRGSSSDQRIRVAEPSTLKRR
jgi:hypothetical protein